MQTVAFGKICRERGMKRGERKTSPKDWFPLPGCGPYPESAVTIEVLPKINRAGARNASEKTKRGNSDERGRRVTRLKGPQRLGHDSRGAAAVSASSRSRACRETTPPPCARCRVPAGSSSGLCRVGGVPSPRGFRSLRSLVANASRGEGTPLTRKPDGVMRQPALLIQRRPDMSSQGVRATSFGGSKLGAEPQRLAPASSPSPAGCAEEQSASCRSADVRYQTACNVLYYMMSGGTGVSTQKNDGSRIA
jgi:hypothetical protein